MVGRDHLLRGRVGVYCFGAGNSRKVPVRVCPGMASGPSISHSALLAMEYRSDIRSKQVVPLPFQNS